MENSARCRLSRAEFRAGRLGAQTIEDVIRITAFVAAENPVAAARIARELLLAGDSLAVFPRRGRPVLNLPGRRELLALRPYVIVYRVLPGDETVDILRVWHALQDRS